jgi:hypothetical protein
MSYPIFGGAAHETPRGIDGLTPPACRSNASLRVLTVSLFLAEATDVSVRTIMQRNQCARLRSYVWRAVRWPSCLMRAAGFLALRTHFDVAEES